MDIPWKAIHNYGVFHSNPRPQWHWIKSQTDFLGISLSNCVPAPFRFGHISVKIVTTVIGVQNVENLYQIPLLLGVSLKFFQPCSPGVAIMLKRIVKLLCMSAINLQAQLLLFVFVSFICFFFCISMLHCPQWTCSVYVCVRCLLSALLGWGRMKQQTDKHKRPYQHFSLFSTPLSLHLPISLQC